MTQEPQIKSQKAYKSISEVAKMLELTNSAIRFWGKEFKQIKPTLINKRRYYSQENIKIIETIKELLYEKRYTLNGAKKYLVNLKSSDATAESFQSEKNLKIKKIIDLLRQAKGGLEEKF